MISGIVYKDVDERHGGIVALQLFQHLFGCLGIDLLGLDKGELKGFKIKRALNVQALSVNLISFKKA